MQVLPVANTTVLTAVLSVMALLFVAAVLSMLTRRVKLPFPVTLVVVGLALGTLIRRYPLLAPFNALKLTPEVLTYIFLPTLTFQAAFTLDARLLTRNLLPILALAIPATFLAAIVAGFGLHYALGFPIAAAMIFGALISSSDGGAVLAVFNEVGAPKRLKILAEGENLLNDATSIVLFKLLTILIAAGGTAVALTSRFVAYGLVSFVVTFLGGLAVGLGAGVICGRLVAIVDDDDLIEILLTTVIAFLAFLAAEGLGVSGVMAVVGAGLILGGWGRTKYTPETLHYLESFWGYLAYVVNALTFLLVGLFTDLTAIRDNLGSIAIAVAIALIGRAVGI